MSTAAFGTPPRILLGGAKTIAVVCAQFGDTGKGKFVDYFSDWAQVIARGTGGDNAGHTICIGDEKFALHLIPAGILRKDKICVIGSGMAVNPRSLKKEVEYLRSRNIEVSAKNLKVSHKAKLLLIPHVLLDHLRESKDDSIGTTKRGIGPCYEDHVGRRGLTLNDLLNPGTLEAKLRTNIAEKLHIIRSYPTELVRRVMTEEENLGRGQFYDETEIFNITALVQEYLTLGEMFREMIQDTDSLIRDIAGALNLLLEGAQSTCIGIDTGTYPNTTSSDPTPQGLAKGVGLDASFIDIVFQVFKGFYQTVVGKRPFPTEMVGDEEKLGAAIRTRGGEFGTTTGRPRRIGWIDLPILRYSLEVTNSTRSSCQTYMISTKSDVLDGLDEIKICTHYVYKGPDYQLGNMTLRHGHPIETAIPLNEVLAHCKPVYEKLPGWNRDTTKMRHPESLPKELVDALRFVESKLGEKIALLSVGPERDQTIIM